MATPDLERLATLVHNRRTELKLGIEPAAKLAGISKDTWKRVEAGLKVWDSKLSGIDTALQWAPGSCLRTLAGKDPIVSEPADDAPDAHINRIPKPELERIVGDAVQKATITTIGSLPGEKVLKLNEAVLRELRERGVI